ncbi:hypothetical protein [Paenibacillus apiarius]|uniref:Butirosin biosynthesis protein H N-terminal domain-containing protein n=1 Tax=Paenibacillus apiarius TaxID=46240 RepID=A0ABT4DQZ8_9BACL|nr:hypothetical protein [Paenibacillus apiarius]MCY9512518.1 hypothetical protein [Paenibacillus apiarius]MCY9519789.1 hypothetical protein [Paenibacillus apiarius]MCY9553106.1 hypothetical protein [Paenibacillus apiarius]MCY9559326.1 hypothetical protein [Paenibacillus apiarius]MCY9682685.1 hypothetical protein [Paenibacillus apiarius]
MGTISSEFPCKTGDLCFTVNIMNFFEFYQIKHKESWISGVLGTFGFSYNPGSSSKFFDISGRNGEFIDFFARLQSKLKEPLTHTCLEVDEVVIFLKKLHKSRKLPLIWINNYYLDYSSFYKISTYWSLVIVLGIESEKVTIFDNGIKSIPFQLFLDAVGKSGYVDLYYSDNGNLDWNREAKSLIIDGLSMSINCLKTNTINENHYKGISGMYYFAEEIDVFCNIHLFTQINKPGGLTQTRQSMGDLLLILTNQFSLFESGERFQSNNIYFQLASTWRKIGNLIYKYTLVHDNELLARINKLIYSAIEAEEKGLLILECVVKRLKK